MENRTTKEGRRRQANHTGGDAKPTEVIRRIRRETAVDNSHTWQRQIITNTTPLECQTSAACTSLARSKEGTAYIAPSRPEQPRRSLTVSLIPVTNSTTIIMTMRVSTNVAPTTGALAILYNPPHRTHVISQRDLITPVFRSHHMFHLGHLHSLHLF